MEEISIYVDGACSGNPGPGGWAAVLLWGIYKKEISGGNECTTNNRMEMIGLIKALECVKKACTIHVYSDSAYLVNAFKNNWIENWQAKNWRQSNKKPVANKDLWEQLVKLTKRHNMLWHKVKGHSGDYYNELCDKMAKNAIL